MEHWCPQKLLMYPSYPHSKFKGNQRMNFKALLDLLRESSNVSTLQRMMEDGNYVCPTIFFEDDTPLASKFCKDNVWNAFCTFISFRGFRDAINSKNKGHNQCLSGYLPISDFLIQQISQNWNPVKCSKLYAMHGTHTGCMISESLKTLFLFLKIIMELMRKWQVPYFFPWMHLNVLIVSSNHHVQQLHIIQCS